MLAQPSCVRAIYDAGAELLDRYTVVTCYPEHSGMFTMLGLSDNPCHPQGFSQMTMGHDGEHLGTRLSWDDLSETLQRHIVERLS